MAEGPEKNFFVKPVEPEGLKKARERVQGLQERARVNELVKIIQELEEEVEGMKIASRFSATAKIHAENFVPMGPTAVLNPTLRELTEAEFKRKSLLSGLEQLRHVVTQVSSGIEDIVLDIEATKTEDTPPEETPKIPA